MKFLILCFFVAAECAAIGVNGYVSTLQTFAVGIKITSSRGGATCTKTKTGPECADDCSTLMICSTFDTAPLDKKICQAPNQYCVKDSCTSVADAKCGGGASVGTDFLCTDVGLFPEPSDCTKYYECSDSGNSQPYVCPSGFVFNSKINVCQIGKTPCTKISCDKATEANPFILYTSNPAFYAYCKKNALGKFDIIMLKCPHEQFEVFDLKTSQCVFKCEKKGNFQNPANCGEYYSCSGANAKPILTKCPTQWVFDGTGCNQNVDKCQYTTTTTTAAPSLTPVKDADTGVITMFTNLKNTIAPEICSADPQADGEICPDLLPSVDFVPKKFRTKDDSGDIYYFVSLKVKDSYYHVKLLVPSGDIANAEVKKVIGPKDEDADIEEFN